jgi:hypothetical protein
MAQPTMLLASYCSAIVPHAAAMDVAISHDLCLKLLFIVYEFKPLLLIDSKNSITTITNFKTYYDCCFKRLFLPKKIGRVAQK